MHATCNEAGERKSVWQLRAVLILYYNYSSNYINVVVLASILWRLFSTTNFWHIDSFWLDSQWGIERIARTQLPRQYIKKQRHHFADKVNIVNRYESWSIKKAECQRIDAFELRYWRRLFRVPRAARRSNQSILKEINTEYSLEELMLKLKFQHFGHLMEKSWL